MDLLITHLRKNFKFPLNLEKSFRKNLQASTLLSPDFEKIGNSSHLPSSSTISHCFKRYLEGQLNILKMIPLPFTRSQFFRVF